MTIEKKIRTDKKKNMIKVLKEVINEPLQSQRDIAEKTWLWLWTVNGCLNQLEQSWTLKEKKIVDFVDLDLELQELCTREMIRRAKDQTAEVNNQDIVRFNETAFKRSQILWMKDKWWDSTIIIQI